MNSGIANHGGTVNVNHSAVGPNATYHASGRSSRPERLAALGIITMKPLETQAVRDELGLVPTRAAGLHFHEGTVDGMRVAALQTLAQGNRSVIMACQNLQRIFNPPVIVLTGIAGGIHKDVELDDVVIATSVIYYDLRKLTPDGTRHRSDEKPSAAHVVNAVNHFFVDKGEPAAISGFRVHGSPIGSGEAVIAEEESEIVRHLQAYNDKVLAVDMEAGGFTQAFYEQAGDHTAQGWVVVRGISDHAGADRHYGHHEPAARNAAVAVRKLMPYLQLD
ncbi:5'-methylthioadenosine/S-adenosylhomocysteine nucleosidase [Herbidospora galbida]|uniref:5'-methylthioadenosine/S-adenosylhomocysteine nucleosidase n=1 Tax=Herbidospora galbida TaxID=2575442 RepID=A0A4U3M9H2_9ACTN|nr:5'-methylthioadenosine/S-adenosylhomocysteine nucleosidase [Herbidospora galbida]TKK85230.1 5'-methylthioadenosine/S-adenosylhomocysteine nucleosidase [Herbidospora galbida]